MKGLILDIRAKEAVALDQEGIYRIIENKNYQIGQEIELEESLVETNLVSFPAYKGRGLRRAIAASVAFVLLAGAGSVALPFSQVKAKAASSITYKVNVWNRVIGIEGDDEEGKELAGQISLGFMGEPLDQVIEQTVDIMEKQSDNSSAEKIEFYKKSFSGKWEKEEKEFVNYQEDWKDYQEKKGENVTDTRKDSKDGQSAGDSGKDGKGDEKPRDASSGGQDPAGKKESAPASDKETKNVKESKDSKDSKGAEDSDRKGPADSQSGQKSPASEQGQKQATEQKQEEEPKQATEQKQKEEPKQATEQKREQEQNQKQEQKQEQTKKEPSGDKNAGAAKDDKPDQEDNGPGGNEGP